MVTPDPTGSGDLGYESSVALRRHASQANLLLYFGVPTCFWFVGLGDGPGYGEGGLGPYLTHSSR